jgi:C-terminal processing protease CtpA/Prc
MKLSPLLSSVATVATIVGMFSASPASAQQAVTVVEYYNKSIAAYFLTGRAAEQATLDGISTFERTGVSFVATTAAGAAAPLDGVCRYRIAITGSSFSSHFYGLTADCATIASYNLSNFFNEGFDFAVERPSAGACPASSPVPVYRALRKQSPVDVPNHRYSTSQTAYQEMLTRGWTGEGIVFCAKSATPETLRATFASSGNYEDRCAVPRVGSSPYTGVAYPDRQGTLSDERNWLRSWSDETYLWYREIPALNAASYLTATSFFDALKTPALALSGAAKDRFHFYDSTDSVEAQRVGTSASYGIKWSLVRTSPPRKLLVAVVDAGSPAALSDVARGASILSIDGVSLVNGSNVNVLNRGIYPENPGETHTFELLDVGATSPRTVTLTAQSLNIQPVPRSGYVETPSGRVGYLALTTFGTYASEAALANAFAGLQGSNLKDLVLDLRYNGGGYLDISAQLAYMIAGPARTAGRTYEKTRFNDKLPYGLFGSSAADVLTPFHATTLGFSLSRGQALPTLNLGRVYVLTSGSSCSASEALVNGLRGIGVEVILIGSTTCGKPYGFYATDNCGTTYYSIQFTGVNERGEGDYVEGFSATCAASDDITKALGDPTEQQFAAALSYRQTGVCAPALSESKRASADGGEGALRTSRVHEENVKLWRVPAPLRNGMPGIAPRPADDLTKAR